MLSLRAWRPALIGLAAFVAIYIAYWVIYALDREFHAYWLGTPETRGGEDKAMEWLGFIGFLGASVFSFWALRYKAWMKPKLVFLTVFGAALFYFVCAGEEISWGQRVFGWETPEAYAKINMQGETNLHNLETGWFHPKDVVSWWMKLFGIFLPIIFYFAFKGRDHVTRRCVSAISLVPLFVFVEIFNKLEKPFVPLAREWFDPAARRLVRTQHEELVEMYWGLCVFFAAIGMYRAWRRASSETPEPERA